MKIQITYFKRTGKFYTEEPLELPGMEDNYQLLELVRGLFKQGIYPGLSCSQWEGFALIQPRPDGVPRLVDCGSLHQPSEGGDQGLLKEIRHELSRLHERGAVVREIWGRQDTLHAIFDDAKTFVCPMHGELRLVSCATFSTRFLEFVSPDGAVGSLAWTKDLT